MWRHADGTLFCEWAPPLPDAPARTQQELTALQRGRGFVNLEEVEEEKGGRERGETFTLQLSLHGLGKKLQKG